MSGLTRARTVPLIGFYALYFGALGVTLPFFPLYLRGLSLSGKQIGVLLALIPLFSLVAPPVWGHLADRLGRPDLVLRLVSFGAFAGFAPLLVVTRFASLIAVVAVYAFFASSVIPVIDSIALEQVARSGGNYSRIRLFGSLAFVFSSAAFGFLFPAVDRMTVVVPLCLIGGYFAWSGTLSSRRASTAVLHPLAGFRLLRQQELAILLGAACLHWIACAPFHGSFSIHVRSLGLASSVVGISAGLGVLAESGVMFLYPRLAERIAPRHLLFLAFAISGLRWIGMSLVKESLPIILLSLLHGMTFGAFYVASIAFLGSRVPAALRTSGQALFASVTFGLGGLVGYLLSGVGYDAFGGHRLFAFAAMIEFVAAGLVLRAKPATSSQTSVRAFP